MLLAGREGHTLTCSQLAPPEGQKAQHCDPRTQLLEHIPGAVTQIQPTSARGPGQVPGCPVRQSSQSSHKGALSQTLRALPLPRAGFLFPLGPRTRLERERSGIPSPPGVTTHQSPKFSESPKAATVLAATTAPAEVLPQCPCGFPHNICTPPGAAL